MIAVAGLGFVGLTTALGFCEKGLRVFAYDIDAKKTDLIRRKKVPFHEPHLREKLAEHLGGNLAVVDSLTEAVKASRVIFFCVGTPCGPDGNADLSALQNAVGEALKAVDGGELKILVIKSTVPPGVTKEVIAPLIAAGGLVLGHDVALANNPEFLREGYAWEDFVSPDRIVIGTDGAAGMELLEEIYHSFNAPIFRVSWNTAEFIKYLSNTLLATLISYSNEMSCIARAIGGIEIGQAFRILHTDKRWSGSPAKMTSYVYPGCGFGGYCLPKDTLALCARAEAKGYSPGLIRQVLQANERIKDRVTEQILQTAARDETVGILGLAFKPNSDDVRDSPSRAVIAGLLEAGHANITAYDPLAMNNFHQAYALPIEYAGSMEALVQAASVVVILTAWDEFVVKRKLLADRRVLDFRYILPEPASDKVGLTQCN